MDTDVPKAVINNTLFNTNFDEVSISTSRYQAKNLEYLDIIKRTASECNATILDTTTYLCDKTKCSGTINKKPLYFDNNHLTETGNKLLIPLFKTIWNQENSLRNNH